MENRKNKSLFQKLFGETDFDEEYEDEFDDFGLGNNWFYNRYFDTRDKATLKRNVKEKLCTNKKMTFDEYTTLLEIVVDTFRDSFNCNNGKFDIIFRERPIMKNEKLDDEKENGKDERE